MEMEMPEGGRRDFVSFLRHVDAVDVVQDEHKTNGRDHSSLLDKLELTPSICVLPVSHP